MSHFVKCLSPCKPCISLHFFILIIILWFTWLVGNFTEEKKKNHASLVSQFCFWRSNLFSHFNPITRCSNYFTSDFLHVRINDGTNEFCYHAPLKMEWSANCPQTSHPFPLETLKLYYLIVGWKSTVWCQHMIKNMIVLSCTEVRWFVVKCCLTLQLDPFYICRPL